MVSNKPDGWGKMFYKEPAELSYFRVRVTDGPTLDIPLHYARERVSKSGKAYLFRTYISHVGHVILCIPVSSFDKHLEGKIRAVPIFVLLPSQESPAPSACVQEGV